MHEDLNTLRTHIEKLDTSDQGFARDLVAQLDRFGGLSQKQWMWIGILAKRTTAPKPLQLTRIVELMQTAKKHIQQPKISMNGLRIKEAARHAGVYYVTTRTDGSYWGSIKNGQFFANQQQPGDLAPILQQLKDLEADPAKAASAYGRATGECCFCARALTDERSTSVGYGPICADRFALPWGK